MLVKLINSYVTVEEADAYFVNTLQSEEWNKFDTSVKEKALITATRQIDRLHFSSRKLDLYQNLEFPRVDSALPFTDGIPQAVVYAVCEQALFVLKGGSKRQELQKQGVKSYSLGDLSETFVDNLSPAEKTICPEALSYLRRYLLGSVAIC
jgi:hypothetical protein